jgi:hypothetical protein
MRSLNSVGDSSSPFAIIPRRATKAYCQ